MLYVFLSRSPTFLIQFTEQSTCACRCEITLLTWVMFPWTCGSCASLFTLLYRFVTVALGFHVAFSFFLSGFFFLIKFFFWGGVIRFIYLFIYTEALGTEPRTFLMLCTCSTTELYTPPSTGNVFTLTLLFFNHKQRACFPLILRSCIAFLTLIQFGIY